MNSVLPRLVAFAARHWLRLGLVAAAVLLLSQKQIDFNVRLGHPDPAAVPATGPGVLPAAPVTEADEQLYLTDEGGIADAGGFFSRFNLFGGGEADLYEVLQQRPADEVADFVARFRHVAEAEQEKFGIPVSITLATGLLYSRAGQAAGAREANNFFGLGCDGGWNGSTGRASGACIRRYETAWTSFRDFSLYLTTGTYGRLAQFGPRDYRRWAAGLQELGFNGNDALAGQLQRTIDRYQLFRFD